MCSEFRYQSTEQKFLIFIELLLVALPNCIKRSRCSLHEIIRTFFFYFSIFLFYYSPSTCDVHWFEFDSLWFTCVQCPCAAYYNECYSIVNSSLFFVLQQTCVCILTRAGLRISVCRLLNGTQSLIGNMKISFECAHCSPFIHS